MLLDLLLALIAGSLTTLNPCVLPILPLVVAGAMAHGKWAPLAMGVGLAASYALIGLFVATVGESIGLDADRVRLLGGILIFLFGLVQLIPFLNDRFVLWLSPLANKAHGATPSDQRSLVAALLTGALLGLAWTPCSGPLLGAALTLVADAGGAWRGAIILGFFGLGAAVPLVLIAYVSKSQFLKFRDWMLNHANQTKKFIGVLLVTLGLGIMTGYDKKLEALLVNLMPDWLITLTTSI